MKTSSLLVGLAVLIIAGVALSFFFAPEPVEAPLPTETVGVDEGASQFLQRVPDDVSMTEPDVNAVGDIDVQQESSVTITIDDSGFSPAQVTVAQGATVTFVNNGQAAHWPASDSHPTHTILPDFDAKRGLATGESYSYTFTQAGTWNFHDHLNPRAQGAVTVQ